MLVEQSYDKKEIFIRCNKLRGLMALVVLFSHIWGFTGLVFLVPFNKFVTIAVAVFFFLSGYGMMSSSLVKKGYAKGIYLQKIPFLLVMAFTAYAVSVLIQFILKVPNDVDVLFSPFGLMGFLKSTNWYVYELIGFYILFSLGLLIKKPIIRVLFIFICSVAGFIILYYSGLVEAYYNSIFGFSIGMLAGATDFPALMKKFKLGFILGLVLIMISFGLMFIMDKDSILFALIRNVAAAGTLIVILYFCSLIKIDLKINDFLCRISPELYFYHMPVALLFSRVIENPYIYAIVVIIISFILAVIFNIIDRRISKSWKSPALKGDKVEKKSS